MSANINTLYDTMFSVLQSVKSGDMDVDRAKATTEVAQTIINAAKVEIDYMRTTGSTGSAFMETDRPRLVGDTTKEVTGAGMKTITHLDGATITQHKMRG